MSATVQPLANSTDDQGTALDKISDAFIAVKKKLTAWGTNIENWTNKHLPPTAAKCAMLIVKLVPFALAMSLLPYTIVYGVFAVAAIVRYFCPEIYSAYPKHYDVFITAARVMGVYSAFHFLYNAAATSFSSNPQMCLVAMAVHFVILGACFHVADGWTEDQKKWKEKEAKAVAAISQPAPLPQSASASIVIPPPAATAAAVQPPRSIMASLLSPFSSQSAVDVKNPAK